MTVNTDKRLALLISRFIHKVTILDRNEKMYHGVTLSQHYTIGLLYRKKKLTMNELSKEQGLAMSTLTRNVDILVRDNIIKRSVNPEDRRKVIVELTSKGQEIANKINGCTQRFWVNILASIPEEKKNELVTHLKLLVKAMNEASNRCPITCAESKEKND